MKQVSGEWLVGLFHPLLTARPLTCHQKAPFTAV